MSEEAFFAWIWFASMIALIAIMGYRIASGDWISFRETSLAASAWCSISAVGVMILRWSGLNLFED